jgi:protein-tyrosine phosphatase
VVDAKKGIKTFMKSVSVLFVCLGNICRSPTAEAVMNTLIKEEKLDKIITCDSAGTSDHHGGDESDPRSVAISKRRGHNVTSRSRVFKKKDFSKFDYILAMDDENFKDIKALDTDHKFSTKIFKMVQFCTTKLYKEVPDPFYGGEDSFELVLDILEDACKGLLEKIRTDHKI